MNYASNVREIANHREAESREVRRAVPVSTPVGRSSNRSIAALLETLVRWIGCIVQGAWPEVGWLVALILELVTLGALAWSRRAAHLTTKASGSNDGPRFGAYRIGEKIGQGGMGVVYKAQHEILGRPAAIKVLPAERARGRELARFEREVRATSMLAHPNTISIYDHGRTEDGALYYAMEYLEGSDLQSLVEKSGAQPPARVAHLLAQLCGALAEAHGAGLLHRDIKPANVFLCDRRGERDVVKVLDFGLVKDLGADRLDGDRTEEGTIVGTPMYLAPEAVTSPDRLDARSDLYAVGALGYFLLTGVAPFDGKTVIEVCCQHLHSEPVPPSARVSTEIPAELEQIILSCLAKSPEERPRDAAQLRAALLPLAAEWTKERAASARASQHPLDVEIAEGAAILALPCAANEVSASVEGAVHVAA
jgi:serine/threonine-protein kinase